jgi:hypothetical protein
MTHLDGIEVSGMSETDILEAQWIYDVERSDASAVQRAATLAAIMLRRQCTVTDLAKRMGQTQSMCSKYLAIDKASPEIKKLLDEGRLDIERAYILTTSNDPMLVQQAPNLKRDELRQKVRGNGGGPKLSSAPFYMPGFIVKLMGKPFTLSEAAEVLMETARILMKADKQHVTLQSQVKCMRDMNKGK